MPQPIAYNAGLPISGSIQENNISYVVDGQQRNYRGGFGGLSWMSEVPPANNLIFIGNSNSIGRGPANIPLFYPAYNNSSANIVYAANTLPGSPRNFTTTASAYDWAVTNNFFINNSDNPIPRIDADGLALYLDANQASSYPQTGTTWYDLSGRANNGTLTNGPSWDSDGYFVFDGVDDYVDCGSGMTATGKITVSALVKFNTFSNPGGASHVVDSNSNSWHLAVLTNGVPYFWNGVTYHQTGTPLSTSRWYMLTGVQGTTLDIYVNGELNNSLNSNLNIATDNVWIGAWALGSRFLNGEVSNAQIYPRALPQTEIKQNYFQSNIVQDGLVFMVDANNIVSYEGSGTTWYNLTGSSGNALLYNGPTYVPQYGGGINRDNTDDFISASISVSTTTNYSVETWFKANPQIGGNYNALISAWNAPGGGAGSWEWQFFNGALGVHPTYNVAYVPNTVAHAVYTQNGTETKIYLNGILQQTSTTSGVDLRNGSIGIGNLSAPGYGGYNLESTFYNIKLYNKTLTPTEIQQNYQATEYKFLGPQIVTNGLVLNLDAANKDSYPGTGTTWTDLSGNGNNGTLINGSSFSIDSGGCIEFDGIDDSVTGNKPVLSAVTLEYYCKLTGNSTGGYPHLVMSGDTFIGFQGNTSSATFRISINPGGGFVEINSTALNPSVTFNLYSMTYDGTTVKMFVNGVQQASTMNIASTFQLMTGNAYQLNAVTTPSFDKAPNKMAAFRIYNRALSATEVAQNYNATKGRFGL